MVMQAWFDDSGKGQEPVYLLAGYVADTETWKGFASDWQDELDRPPKLPYLHANESQIFKGISSDDRIARLVRFVEIIRRHGLRGVSFVMKHSDYREYFRVVSTHPSITSAERRMLKNPYYYAFQIVFSTMLLRQGKVLKDTGVRELIHILFDTDIDRRSRLELGFKYFLNSVNQRAPDFLELLVNRSAEFRDDKVYLPLQACDLFAWHLRRFCERGNAYADPIWLDLRNGIEYETYAYREELFVDVLNRLRDATWRAYIAASMRK